VSSSWRVADVVRVTPETAHARSLTLRIPGLTGNLAGQHVDIRLTADDGYSAVRSYSVATAGSGDELDVTVDELPDGEVSPYLVEDVSVGDQLEVRGPVGGWFVWRPTDQTPVQLIGAGSGIVPLMSMIRAHEASDNSTPFRLLYSVRSPELTIYREELASLATASTKLTVDYIYTRSAPAGWDRPPHRIQRDELLAGIMPADADPALFICGQTVFVESVSGWLVKAGYSPGSVKTERYGGTGAHRE
jgi:ferredoxin-NADP reductase